jgi:hypothetical protein
LGNIRFNKSSEVLAQFQASENIDTVTHCAFSSNLFHGQIAQIYIDHLSGMKTKNVALKKLMNETPSNPDTFEQERP